MTTSAAERGNTLKALRPIHFMVTFWGERYRSYFVDLLLPSLLSPRNLPLLSRDDGHRFFIATPREDWQSISDLPIVTRLRRHAEPNWVEVAAQPQDQSNSDAHARYVAMLEHMTHCQRIVLEAAYQPS